MTTMDHDLPDADFFTPRELADALKVSLHTVYGWNRDESPTAGPAYIRIGRHIRYPRASVLEWLESRAVVQG